MTDIQRARDVFEKWRKDSGQWKTDRGGDHISELDGSHVASHVIVEDACLIVGTAGNPELLDAIDEMLRIADTRMARREEPAFILHAERIAAAIIAADERMSA